eukprot:74244-Pelagomonas_calceolata.AAC.3
MRKAACDELGLQTNNCVDVSMQPQVHRCDELSMHLTKYLWMTMCVAERRPHRPSCCLVQKSSLHHPWTACRYTLSKLQHACP